MVTQNTEKAPKIKYITNKQINKVSRQHSRPKYAATQTEGLLIRGRTGLSASPHEDQGRGVHNTRAHSPPALGETRPDILRLCDIKKKKILINEMKETAAVTQGPESSAPRGETCVHIMRARSSCTSRREASEASVEWGERLGERVVNPGASDGPVASVTVNQIYCRRR